MAHITDLPQDLIDSLIPLPYKPTAVNIRMACLNPEANEDFTFFERHRTLLSLAKTCRRLWDMLHEELYRSVFVEGRHKFQKMLTLIRAIDQHPALFRETTQFYLSPTIHDGDDEKSYWSLRPKDIEYLKHATRKAGLTTMEMYWITSKSKYPGDYLGVGKGKIFGHEHRLGLLAQLILLRLPNVEGIKLPISMLTLHQPAGFTKFPARVRMRSLAITEDPNPERGADLVPKELGMFYKFRLNIEELYYENANILYDVNKALFSFSRITRLVLHRYNFKFTEEVECLFKQLKRLNTVIYIAGTISRIPPATIVEYLIRHNSGNLTTLVINCPPNGGKFPNPVESFKGLSKLSNLWILGSNFSCPKLGHGDVQNFQKKTGLRSLSGTLRRLHIKGATPALHEDMKLLESAIAAQQFPDMKEIAVEDYEPISCGKASGVVYKPEPDRWPWTW